MFHLLWHLLLGSYCVLCREPVKGADSGRQLCSYCLASLPWLEDPEPIQLSGIQRTFVPLAYQGAVRRWVLAAKHEGGLVAARTLGVLLAESLAEAYPFPAERPELLIPVPLSTRRLRRRGHNQAILIGAQVARALNIPMRRHTARRTRHTAMLADLDAIGRRAEVAGGFSARKLPAGCRVAIVDDVVTSGATAAELAGVLQDAGAAEVHLWAASSATHLD